MSPAPVIIFTYKRTDSLTQTIEALQKNALAPGTDVIIFSDGAKTAVDKVQVDQVRLYLKKISGFKTVTINESKHNMGLANSIISGVTDILEFHERVIVLEDDLVTSPNFLCFMNAALNHYDSNEKVFSISGYTGPIKIQHDYPYDNYFTKRGSSWGWATWRNRWQTIDWNVADYPQFANNPSAKKRFNRMGSDLSGMLKKQMAGEINSWAIRWSYHQFKNELYSVFPLQSKVRNIGFGKNATHTVQRFNRFDTVLDEGEKKSFNFHPEPSLDHILVKQFVARYGIAQRLIYKILNSLP